MARHQFTLKSLFTASYLSEEWSKFFFKYFFFQHLLGIYPIEDSHKSFVWMKKMCDLKKTKACTFKYTLKRTGGGIHPTQWFFALLSKNRNTTHTWNFLTFPIFWLRIVLWNFLFQKLFLHSLTALFGHPVRKYFFSFYQKNLNKPYLEFMLDII